MHVVFVLAHQDDEIAFASRIRDANARGDRVTCVCLTDGAAVTAASVRDAESRRVLEILGGGAWVVAPPHERIADGTLPDHLDAALAFLESSIADADELVTLAWEGGHQDHDATHLVAAVFAHRRDIRCLEMPLYNGHDTRRDFFRVLHPLGDGWAARPIPLREKLANLLLTRHYHSQRKTWIGLAPMMLLARSRELTRVVDLRRATTPPHRGALLYERKFGYPYAKFAERAEAFVDRRMEVRR
jgi:LmbE family N-acetylglucosaminyl deacetylase